MAPIIMRAHKPNHIQVPKYPNNSILHLLRTTQGGGGGTAELQINGKYLDNL
jgi:hypothetical protein